MPEYFAQFAALAGCGVLLLGIGAALCMQTIEAPAGRPLKKPTTTGAMVAYSVSGVGVVTSGAVALLLGAAGMLASILGLIP